MQGGDSEGREKGEREGGGDWKKQAISRDMESIPVLLTLKAPNKIAADYPFMFLHLSFEANKT